MYVAKVSLGQLDTRALVARMTSLRGEVLAVRGRVVEGSIPHARLTELIAHLDQNTFLITGADAARGAAGCASRA